MTRRMTSKEAVAMFEKARQQSGEKKFYRTNLSRKSGFVGPKEKRWRACRDDILEFFKRQAENRKSISWMSSAYTTYKCALLVLIVFVVLTW